MPTTITIDPVTRIEGHLKIEVVVDDVGGTQQVVDAHCSGTMFRGFEQLLVGRDPRDAVHYTQRICGVCPVSHGMASAMNLEDAFGVTPPDNGRLMRNLALGANFLQSHILHFYHLAAPDYIDTTGVLDMSPWSPRWVTPDMVTGSTAQTLVNHYVQALHIRRKTHQMCAIVAGRAPHVATFVPGGNTEVPATDRIAEFRALLTEVRAFIDGTFLPDINLMASVFADYFSIGTGCGNLLAYGVFDLDAAGSNRLLARGRYTSGASLPVDPVQITEYVQHSWFTPASGGVNPADGVTEPDAHKAGAYSWLKAPRYAGMPHEAGPLARMWVNGDYTNGISVLDRLAARALETKKIADAMDGWLDELVPGQPVYQPNDVPTTASGTGLTEAPRGALGHWVDVSSGTTSRYQVVTPTAWNASPRDDAGVLGPIEQALVGTPVADADQPVELLRVVHSFDPCLACAVHLARPKTGLGETVVTVLAGIA